SGEVDLLIASDGVVRLCEAKTSAYGINIAPIADVAKRIRPDVVTLAVMEVESDALRDARSQLKSLLASDDIDAELLCLSSHDYDDDPNLPHGQFVSVRLI